MKDAHEDLGVWLSPPYALTWTAEDEAHAISALPAKTRGLFARAGASAPALHTLAGLHRRLWLLEDEARSRRASPDRITRVKRAIDWHNGERHQTIDRFDASLAFGPPAAGAVLFGETPGEMSDRLLILELKIRNAGAHAVDPALPQAAREKSASGLTRLTRWRAHLHLCLDGLAEALAERRALIPPRGEMKMYNDPLLNPVIRREASGGEGGHRLFE